MGLGGRIQAPVTIGYCPDHEFIQILEREYPTLDFRKERAYRRAKEALIEAKVYFPKDLLYSPSKLQQEDYLGKSAKNIIEHIEEVLNQSKGDQFIKTMFRRYRDPLRSPFGSYFVFEHKI